MATTATKVTYYGVVWGPDEADQITYTDYGDGSTISTTAEGRAISCWLNFVRNSVPCGLWTNGNLTAGENATGGPDVRPTFPDDPPVRHKTCTVLDACQEERYVTKSNGSGGRYVRSDTATAKCSCGWTYAAGTRCEARSAARCHREKYAA